MTKEQAIQKANEHAAAMQQIELDAARRLRTERKKWRHALLRANRAGATYDELVERCNISDGLLAREIKRARTELPAASRLRHRPAQRPEQRTGGRAA